MNIEVNVTDTDLTSVIGHHYGEDETLADVVAAKLVQQVLSEQNEWKSFRKAVLTIRDEEILKAVAPLIAEALTKPVRQTNGYGDEIGPATTLSEIIVAEARKQLSAKAGNDYRSSDNRSIVQKLVAEEVSKAFGSVIADEVKKARELVGDQIGEQVAAAVKAGLAKR